MGPWCRSTALTGRTQWTFSHAGRSYAVFSVDGELHVTDGACPHNGGPLAEGLVRDGVVTCPWHWYSYELATGRCRTAAGYELRRYPVVLVGGRPHAALPAPEPRAELVGDPARARPPGRSWDVTGGSQLPGCCGPECGSSKETKDGNDSTGGSQAKPVHRCRDR